MITCGITGSDGILGSRIKKTLPFNFYEFRGDIRDKQKVKKWMHRKSFDILIHLAAIVPTNLVTKNYKKAFDVNVNGTKNIINAIIKIKKKPKWIFFSSTSHVYEMKHDLKKISENSKLSPISKYGKTKLIAENLLVKKLKKHKIKVCIGRIFSFTDKKQKIPFVVPSIKKKINNSKKKVILKNIHHYRDFLSIKDIVLAIDSLRKHNKAGIYNIGSGRKFDLRKIAKYLNIKNKKIIFENNVKPTYLIANNNKLSKLNWKPSKFEGNMNYFYQ